MLGTQDFRVPWLPSLAVGRWSTLGPYYAMFPVDFVRRTVEAFCPLNGSVLDPFCGRGTVPYVARATGRRSCGVDLNPVAYVFSKAKTDPEPIVKFVLERITDIDRATSLQDCLPQNEFQRWAWCPKALGFLHAARRTLDWRESRVDRTLMAIILVHLHGKAGNAISNQMRQTKGMAPDYAVRWWRERNMSAPEIDPATYFSAKVRWRYLHGAPGGPTSQIALGDARSILPRVRQRFSMLLTSPPYCDVTNYRVDNWIRLWMLGEGPLPCWETSQRYGHRQRYIEMLSDVLSASARLLEPEAAVYIRTDARPFTRDVTANAMEKLWPGRRLLARHGKGLRSQTTHYGDVSEKPGEIDFLFLPEGLNCPEGFREFGELCSANPVTSKKIVTTPDKPKPASRVEKLVKRRSSTGLNNGPSSSH